MKGDAWTPGPTSRTAFKADSRIDTIRIRTTYGAEQNERGFLDSGTNFEDFEACFQGRLQDWHDSNQDHRMQRKKKREFECHWRGDIELPS
ncbi:unnamed protein product [Caenorhabditis nigoni]